jgi:hypothetical protein
MAVSSRYHVLEFDSETRKCRLGQGNWVTFNNCKSKQAVDQAVNKQKEKDQQKRPPTNPKDRDGYLYCDAGGTNTYHWVETTPPYTDTDLNIPCP